MYSSSDVSETQEQFVENNQGISRHCINEFVGLGPSFPPSAEFDADLGRHVCKYWLRHRKLARISWEISRVIPYCRLWRVCSHCWEDHYRNGHVEAVSYFNSTLHGICAVTMHLPLADDMRNRRDKFLDAFHNWLRERKMKYAYGSELSKGLYHRHYCIAVTSNATVLKVQNYLVPRHMGLFDGGCEVGTPVRGDSASASRLEVKQAADMGWVDYVFGIGYDPSTFCPPESVELRPVYSCLRGGNE